MRVMLGDVRVGAPRRSLLIERLDAGPPPPMRSCAEPGAVHSARSFSLLRLDGGFRVLGGGWAVQGATPRRNARMVATACCLSRAASSSTASGAARNLA